MHKSIVGNRNNIELSFSDFKRFIENNNLYVDKTKFIENILTDGSSVLLFTRPRRTGKSLNMQMLRCFLDCKQDNIYLFQNLYISDSKCFMYINKYPVIFLDFKELYITSYIVQLKDMIRKVAVYYDVYENIKSSLDTNSDTLNPSILQYLCELIFNKYSTRPFIIIDEYDKFLMDNIYTSDFTKIKEFIIKFFEKTLKGNEYLERAVLTGVTRLTKEGMFSGLNNLTVYDIFTPSVYDTDFSLTEQEASELLQDFELTLAKDWYNNIRIGNSKLLNIYSVMSYLYFGRLDNYWGRSGTIDLLVNLLNKTRTIELASLFNNDCAFILIDIEPRISLTDLLHNTSGSYFYSLAVQSGYLTFDVDSTQNGDTIYRLYIPNKELKAVWRKFIMTNIVMQSDVQLKNIFESISDIEVFNDNLTSFISYQLSYFDLADELEKIYHMFVFGMVLALGYTCKSNLESGLGRYDLYIEASDFSIIMEFKKAASEVELEAKANTAIKQIKLNKYYANIKSENPVYLIGVGCYKKTCVVRTEKIKA